ncbi:MAG: hypothetical protein WDZ39_01065 [Candidatus Spechtbacterales bacterium]
MDTSKLLTSIMLAVFALAATFLFIAVVSAQQGSGTAEEEKQELQRELDALQRELEDIQQQVNKYQGEAASYERDIAIIEAQIRGVRVEMERNRLVINQTGNAIQTTRETIEELEQKEEDQKELLGKLILSMYKLDDTSAIEIVLTSETLSEFFDDVARVRSLQAGMKDTLDEVKALQEEVRQELVAMEQKMEEQSRLLQIQASRQGELNSTIAQHEQLLKESRDQEYQYREIAQETQKTIQEVRNQIFRLEAAGVAVTFEEAYAHAKRASELTGVRPALLLSVLKQESNWGSNVGQCHLVDPSTGMGRRVNGGLLPRVMAPPSRRNDIGAFMQIAQDAGRDWQETPVSCWIVSMGCTNDNVTQFSRATVDGNTGVAHCPAQTPWLFGFGGAMGPAQFLPTTWMGYHDRVSSLLGRSADPWLILDAFVASATKLSDGITRCQSEMGAARAYFSGSCSSASSVGYGNQVMNRAEVYQRDIDILEGQ